MPNVMCVRCGGSGSIYQAPDDYSLTEADKKVIEVEVEKMKAEGFLKNYYGSKSRIRKLAMKRLGL